MNPDRLAIFVPGTDPAAQRRPCGCRGDRGQHQAGCALRRDPDAARAFRRRAAAWFARVRGIRRLLGNDVAAAEVLAEMRSET